MASELIFCLEGAHKKKQNTSMFSVVLQFYLLTFFVTSGVHFK